MRLRPGSLLGVDSGAASIVTAKLAAQILEANASTLRRNRRNRLISSKK